MPPPDAEGGPGWGADVAHRFADLVSGAVITVWDEAGRLLWSTGPGAGRPAGPEWETARSGRVTLYVKQELPPAGAMPDPGLAPRVSAYLPVLSRDTGQVLGVVELLRDSGPRRSAAWMPPLVVSTVALACGVLLYVAFGHRRRVGWREADTPPVIRGTPLPPGSTLGLSAGLEGADGPSRSSALTERLRTLGERAGGVAHDFNNVLSTILARTQLLLRRVEQHGDPELKRHLELLERAALDGTQTVRRILEFTRGPRLGNTGVASLNQVIEEVIEITRPRWSDEARLRGVAYDVRVYGGSVPPVAADGAELREVLTNLVSNALDAMPRGGGVSFHTGVEGDMAYCGVRDTGTGMSDEVRARIFEPFFTTKGRKGTGLGLNVVKDVIAGYGGAIAVESRLDSGSTFTIRLPVAGRARQDVRTA